MTHLLRQFSATLSTMTQEEFKDITAQLDSTPLKLKEKRSYISLLIQYYLTRDMYSELDDIVSKNKLMKRDYLHYLTYIYFVDIDKAISIFKTVLTKFTILDKDLDFILAHKMYKLCYHLNHYYLSSTMEKPILKDTSVLDFINPLSLEKKNAILKLISKKFKYKDSDIKKLGKKLENVDCIVDGGNVSFAEGVLNYKHTKRILLNVMTKFKNPLLIIHQRHIKNSKCKSILEETGISFFKTPAHVNDDYYIMYSVIKNNCYVVTLDNFKDHIFEIEKYISDINSIVRNYITEKIINYTPDSINSTPEFSKCIQVTNQVYIPTSKGFITI